MNFHQVNYKLELNTKMSTLLLSGAKLYNLCQIKVPNWIKKNTYTKLQKCLIQVLNYVLSLTDIDR